MALESPRTRDAANSAEPFQDAVFLGRSVPSNVTSDLAIMQHDFENLSVLGVCPPEWIVDTHADEADVGVAKLLKRLRPDSVYFG